MKRAGTDGGLLPDQAPPRRKEDAPYVSLVVPVWDEKNVLPDLYRQSRTALDGMGRTWEILFVDDGSTDGSEAVLRGLHEGDGRVRVLFLERNFGQHPALSAGLEHARGEVVVIMDGDLQFDPQDIPRLVGKLEQGYDLVGGWRRDRKDPPLSRKVPSRFINALLGRATGVTLRDYNCGFKAMRAHTVRKVNAQGDRRRYLAPLLVLVAERVAEIPVAHRARPSGTSKYTLLRSAALVLRLAVFVLDGSIRQGRFRTGRTGRSLCHAPPEASRATPSGSAVPLFVLRETLPPSRGCHRPTADPEA